MTGSSGPGPGARRIETVRVLRGAIIVLAIALVVLLAAAGVLLVTGGGPGSGERTTVEIPSGSSTAEIAAVLADAGVIDQPLLFRIGARLSGADGDLKAGTYELKAGLGYRAAIDALREGPAVIHRTVTIPEGFVIEQIAERLEQEAGVPAGEFVEAARHGAPGFVEGHPYLADAYDGSLEGYLFPKTYRVRVGSSAEEVIETMLDQFDTEIAQVDLAYPESRGLTLHQVVTLASMIEREARVPTERTIVSSVIYNRLERGMRLEIDATIEYVLPGNRFRLKASDLEVDSPYNTYRNAGLPPGPIASPGLAALKAAAGPTQTGFLYYVLTGKDGSHTFAETREEFLAAKQRSKEVFGK